MTTSETLQINFDQDLARDLQANPEAQKLGVPEFVQRAVRFYLRRSEELEIRRQYQKGYGGADLADLALEMKDWEEEQVWPEPKATLTLQEEFTQWDQLSDEALIDFEKSLR